MGTMLALGTSIPVPFAEAASMQNPIFNGINRARLTCAPPETVSDHFCPALLQAVQELTGLKTEMQSRTDMVGTGTATQFEIGVLLIELETRPSPSSGDGHHGRLVWQNPKPVRGGPAKFVGEWVSLPSYSSATVGVQGSVGELTRRHP